MNTFTLLTCAAYYSHFTLITRFMESLLRVLALYLE